MPLRTFRVVVVATLLATATEAQILWQGRGHIPQPDQVDWTVAGLLADAPLAADHVVSIVVQPGANDDDRMAAALETARGLTADGTNGRTVVLYFPAGTYRLTRTVLLGPEESHVVFQGAGAGLTRLEFATPGPELTWLMISVSASTAQTLEIVCGLCAPSESGPS